MKLEDILREKKPAILKKWLDAIMETYPPEIAGLLKEKKNRFTDPVGYTIHDGMDNLIDGLIREAPLNEISPFLDSIVKIRAVQDFSASQAVAFIFDLKWIINEELQDASHASGAIDAATLSAFESKIDNLALISFDLYMESREKIYELKAEETRNMVYRLVQRQNQLYGVQGQGLYIETPNLS